MNINKKLNILKQIYKLYNSFISEIDTSCKAKCNDCCTRDVIITSLEGYYIADYLINNDKESFFDLIECKMHLKRYQPKITINELAEICKTDKKIPDDVNHYSELKCPLLKNDECLIYSKRPFACRSFVSLYKCSKKGFATIDPFVISVNNMFQQIIENIDNKGSSGNLSDVLFLMKSERDSYKNDRFFTNPLIKNHFAQVILIPSEHKERIKPVYESLCKAIYT